MARDLTADQTTEIQQDVVHPVLFVFIDYADPLRVSSHVKDLSFGGNTYKGVGDLGGIDTIEETTQLKSSEVALSLSGVPTDLVNDALSATAQENDVKIWLGWLNDDNELVDTPYQIFSGSVDNHQVTMDGETSTIKVNTVSIKRSLNKAVQRRYTSEDHHNEYPNDEFFDNVASLQEKQIQWGGNNNNQNA